MASRGVALGLAGGAAFTKIAATGASFEQTITNASAKFGEFNKESQTFISLQSKAKEVGASTEFAATQAAEGLQFLGEAGFTAEQAIATLPAVTDLATNGQMDFAGATMIATKSLGAFGMRVTDTGDKEKDFGQTDHEHE